MNTIRYNNFTEFYNDHKDSFRNPNVNNQRLGILINTIGGLDKGCSCSKKSRLSLCQKDYRKIGNFMSMDAVEAMRLKNPDTIHEFSDGIDVFYIIPASGEPYWTPYAG